MNSINLRSQEVRAIAPEGAQVKHTAVPKEMHSAISHAGSEASNDLFEAMPYSI